MVLYASAMDDEPDTDIFFKPIYKEEGQNNFVLFDFHVSFTRTPQVDSDGEEEDYSDLETRDYIDTYQFEKVWLIDGDKDYIQAFVYHILELIEVPCYSDIVWRLTHEIWKLKESDAFYPFRNLERIEIVMDVFADRFPGENDVMDVDVIPAVDPASDEAVKTHLETVVVDTAGHCVICMDEIRVESDVAACQMPCQHMFHRHCGEAWLRTSGVCPVCRSVFPS